MMFCSIGPVKDFIPRLSKSDPEGDSQIGVF